MVEVAEIVVEVVAETVKEVFVVMMMIRMFKNKNVEFSIPFATELQYSFPVFDGTPIDPTKVKVFTVPAGTEVILASDGYPEVFPTLAQSETHLHRLLDSDPMCMHENISTKGIIPGNLSFDDRAYIRFTHH